MKKYPRPIAAALLAITLAAAVTGCGETKSPKEQEERERKAAGVAVFKITCGKDMWDRTRKHYDNATGKDRADAMTVTEKPGAMVLVELSGAEMVEYLRILDRHAHGTSDLGEDYENRPLATRMYNAIAPVIDAVTDISKPDQAAPEIVVDDRVIGASPSAAPTP